MCLLVVTLEGMYIVRLVIQNEKSGHGTSYEELFVPLLSINKARPVQRIRASFLVLFLDEAAWED